MYWFMWSFTHAKVMRCRSIGLLLALLSKPPRYRKIEGRHGTTTVPAISSLVLTPHRDLAYQFRYWAESLYNTQLLGEGGLDSIVQVMVRGAATPIEKQIEKATETPPQVLVATPQALLEALSLEKSPLILRELTTVILDEADYLLESLPSKQDKYALLKYARMVARHPTPSRQILDAIYRIQRTLEHRKKHLAKALANAGEANFLDKLKNGIMKSNLPVRRPQLIVTSATLKALLRHSLLVEGKWLTHMEGMLAKIIVHERKEDHANHLLGSHTIVHSALVVPPEGAVVNIKGAVDPSPDEAMSVSKPALEELPATDEKPLLEDKQQPENNENDACM